jgi:pilus retraction protein PilT
MDPRIFLNECLKSMTESNASDLFLKSNSEPRIRVSTTVSKLRKEKMPAELVEKIANTLMNEYHRAQLERHKGVDLAFTSEEYGRYRANIFVQRGLLTIVIRTIKTKIPDFSELAIPSIFEKIAMQDRGLILVAGATSSGKSTTVAALVDFMNRHRDAHIITVEDPIEYLHEDNRCLINQREIGSDSPSFSQALKYVVRQDPDIIVIGEMRDAESFHSALVASETGHLVISTIHSKNVLQVFDRILGFFPVEQHDQILVELSFNLQAVSCQRLLRKKDNKGLIPGFEILIQNPTINKLIRERKLDKIYQALKNCAEDGMQTFNQGLIKLVAQGLISREEALAGSDNPQALEMNLQGIFLDDTSGGILDT